MPQRFFRKVSDRYKQKDQPWYLRPFAFFLTHPVYFSANRKTVAGGLWLGLFISFMPVPGHTALAVISSLLLRVNLPVAAVAVWVTNPLTILPVLYLSYRLGCAVLNIPIGSFPEEITLSSMSSELADIWMPLWYGSLILGTAVASAGYILISLIWRLSTAYRYRRRHLYRRAGRSMGAPK